MRPPLKPLFLGLILFFPLWYIGLFRSTGPIFPSSAVQIYGTAGVFEDGSPVRAVFLVEIQPDPESPWQPRPLDSLFSPSPWGAKSCFLDLMYLLIKDNGLQGRQELAEWILRQTPGTTSRSKLRFVKEVFPVQKSGSPRTPISERILSTHGFASQ